MAGVVLPLDTIIHGDCLDVLRSLPDASVDAVVTDPPYSSGTRREAAKGLRKSMTRGKSDAEWFGADSLTMLGFTWLIHACAVEWQRVLAPGGNILSFIDWRMMPHMAGAIESADLRYTGLLVWDKTYFGMGRTFRKQHELVLHFTKGVGRAALRHDVGDVIACKPIRHGSHPTEKPVALLHTLLSVVCPPGGTVLDPFAGSGTTCVAAKGLGMRYIGIEREAAYVDIARARLGEAQPERPTDARTLWEASA